MEKFKGWGRKGRPFSPSEFERSHVKENIEDFSYGDYLTSVGKQSKNKRMKKTLFG